MNEQNSISSWVSHFSKFILWGIFSYVIFHFSNLILKDRIETVFNNKLQEIAKIKNRKGTGQIITGPILNIPICEKNKSYAEKKRIKVLPDSLFIKVSPLKPHLTNSFHSLIPIYSAQIKITAHFDSILNLSRDYWIFVDSTERREAIQSKVINFDLRFSNTQFISDLNACVIFPENNEIVPLSLPLIKNNYFKNGDEGISFMVDAPKGWIRDPILEINFNLYFSDTLLFGIDGLNNTVHFNSIDTLWSNDSTHIGFRPDFRNNISWQGIHAYNRMFPQIWKIGKAPLETRAVGIQRSLFNEKKASFIDSFNNINLGELFLLSLIFLVFLFFSTRQKFQNISMTYDEEIAKIEKQQEEKKKKESNEENAKIKEQEQEEEKKKIKGDVSRLNQTRIWVCAFFSCLSVKSLCFALLYTFANFLIFNRVYGFLIIVVLEIILLLFIIIAACLFYNIVKNKK